MKIAKKMMNGINCILDSHSSILSSEKEKGMDPLDGILSMTSMTPISKSP